MYVFALLKAELLLIHFPVSQGKKRRCMHKILPCWAVVTFRCNTVTVRVAHLLAITFPCIIWLLRHRRSSSRKSSSLQGSGLASRQVRYSYGLAAVAEHHRLRALPSRNIPDTQTHHIHHHVAYYTEEPWDTGISSWSVVDFSPDCWM